MKQQTSNYQKLNEGFSNETSFVYLKTTILLSLSVKLSLICLLAVMLASTAFSQDYGNKRKLPEGELTPDQLLLKDFSPKTELILHKTDITRAKYPVIDVHMHTRDRDPDLWIKLDNSLNVKKTILLSGALGEKLNQEYKKYVEAYPDRFILFCGLGRQWFKDKDYSEKAVTAIQDAYDMGVRGIGELLDKGLTWGTDYNGDTIDISSPMFDPVWSLCEKLGMPVNIHVFDPPAFYKPIDEHNEQFFVSSRYGFYGRNIYDRETMINKRNAIMERHPKLIIIGAHVGNSAHNLGELCEILDKYPNFYVDLSARSWEYGRQPNTARKFLIKYQDRVMFGTDLGPVSESYLPHFRLLETDDDQIVPQGASRGWNVFGLYLPDEVLRKIYYENAERVIKGVK
jgi:predicted TIM-barrel fold metal-dependent hydrolase